MKKKVIAFVCTHNSCRSIMAEGYAKHLGNDILNVYSAGTEVFPGPKPMAIEVMMDLGIDMSHANSKLLSEIPREIDILITMGCGVECPFIPCKYREDWDLDDPSLGPKSDYEITRDLIKEKTKNLLIRIRNGELE